MDAKRKRSALLYIPGYSNNVVLQLIIVSGVAFAVLGICWAIVKILFLGNEVVFDQYFISNLGLPPLADFKQHWWTVLTYGWFHFAGFFELLSNMLWLYCFGSVVQMLVGHRQIVPMYAYCLVAGGVFYLLSQFFPVSIPHTVAILGSRAGLMGMAAAAFTLTPKYRFYLTDRFSIPMAVVAGIFAVLMILGAGFYIPVLAMLLGGGITGFAYVRLLQAGYRPGGWMYDLRAKVEGLVTPNDNDRRKNKRRIEVFSNAHDIKNVSQKRVDDILDKINQKGYNSLSKEEKEILLRAGKE